MLRDLGDLPGARATHEEALGIRRRLVTADPTAYESDLATSANNLGTVLQSLGELPGATPRTKRHSPSTVV